MLAAIFPMLSQTARCADLDAGLIVHWTFDEGSGSLASDSTPTSADAEFIGDFGWTDGVLDGALEIGSSQGSASLDQQFVFNVTTYSISCWFRCENADRFRVITSRNDGWMNRQWWLTVWEDNYAGHDGGVLAFRMSPVSGPYVDLVSEQRVDDNEWHHAIATVDSFTGEACLYLDGELVDSITGFSMPKLPAVNPRIGQDPSGSNRYFLGAIDDLRIYNRVLTEEERGQLSSVSERTVRVVQWREVGGDSDR
jgi:hypothetical protein